MGQNNSWVMRNRMAAVIVLSAAVAAAVYFGMFVHSRAMMSAMSRDGMWKGLVIGDAGGTYTGVLIYQGSAVDFGEIRVEYCTSDTCRQGVIVEDTRLGTIMRVSSAESKQGKVFTFAERSREMPQVELFRISWVEDGAEREDELVW